MRIWEQFDYIRHYTTDIIPPSWSTYPQFDFIVSVMNQLLLKETTHHNHNPIQILNKQTLFIIISEKG